MIEYYLQVLLYDPVEFGVGVDSYVCLLVFTEK